MTQPKELITREFDQRLGRVRGKIVSQPTQSFFGASLTEGYTWVADVDIGGNRLLQKVPIKLNGTGGRGYAQIGMPVFLERNEGQRWEIIGPADRTRAQGNRATYDPSTGTTTLVGNSGFGFTVVPYSFYATIEAGAPLGTKYNNGVDPYNKVVRTNELGQEV